ncbi:MAG: hypothetical protein AAFX04_09085 [Pseudomonadota bacterium]
MTLFSSFEILAENLVPNGVLPPTAANPFALQGYFVQISLVPGASATQFNIVFDETTQFNSGMGRNGVFAQYIDANGNVNIVPGSTFFGSTSIGFLYQTINAGETLIYGVQAISPPTATEQDVAIPQGGTGWRGTVQIAPTNPGSLIATPTHRLVYYNGDDITTDSVIDAVVYSVPTFTGATKV